MSNVVTLMSGPVLIKPWKLNKLIDFIETFLKPYTDGKARTVTNIGQISDGQHVLSIFLRTDEPGDLPEKLDELIANLNPLLSKPIEITVHDFRTEQVRQLYAGPDPSALKPFEAECSKWRDMDAIDEMRYPGLDDVEYESAIPAPAFN